mmetsp:Transcript_5245/g.9752  ORF Transcript_5245/g.9752 Transcript_5245/m.9752 type:complete len:219 (-) Transcript_5245:522-1178(-)
MLPPTALVSSLPAVFLPSLVLTSTMRVSLRLMVRTSLSSPLRMVLVLSSASLTLASSAPALAPRSSLLSRVPLMVDLISPTTRSVSLVTARATRRWMPRFSRSTSMVATSLSTWRRCRRRSLRSTRSTSASTLRRTSLVRTLRTFTRRFTPLSAPTLSTKRRSAALTTRRRTLRRSGSPTTRGRRTSRRNLLPSGRRTTSKLLLSSELTGNAALIKAV